MLWLMWAILAVISLAYAVFKLHIGRQMLECDSQLLDLHGQMLALLGEELAQAKVKTSKESIG